MMHFVSPRTPDADTPTLMARLVQGDRAALAGLYRREAPAVYRYALALCSNTAWAADAVQDAFLALARDPSGFDPRRGTLGAYLAGAARHALLAQWRQGRREQPLPGSDDDDRDDACATDDDAADAASPETVLLQAQDTRALWAALRALPWGQREAVVLVDLQDRPYAEAARIAGTELNTLRTRLHRARAHLARLLGPPPLATPAADTSTGAPT